MFLTKWKEIFMIVWAYLKIFIVIQGLYQEEELLKWKFPQELTKKEANIQVLNNYHSKQVHFIFILVGYAL
jgi:hypothetical protein